MERFMKLIKAFNPSINGKAHLVTQKDLVIKDQEKDFIRESSCQNLGHDKSGWKI